MDTHSVFLDTNVYLGYAYNAPFEKHHSECCYVFDASHFHRYTSMTVNQELNKKKHDRKKLYKGTLKHCLSGRQLKEFKISDLGRSEANHFVKMIADAHKSDGSEVEYIRNLQRSFFTRLMGCLEKRTCQPLIPYSNDGDLKSFFALDGVHSPDERVLADFFTWAIDGNDCCLVTGDGRLYDLRMKVLKTVSERKGRNVSHLSIEHISVIPSRFPAP